MVTTKNDYWLTKRNQLMALLPKIISEQYLYPLEIKQSTRTQVEYCRDWLLFFNFLSETFGAYDRKPPSNFTINDLKIVSEEQFQQFAYYIRQYKKYDPKTNKSVFIKNNRSSQLRKLSAVRALFRRFFEKNILPADPTARIDLPTVSSKAVEGRYLSIDEAALYLDAVDKGFIEISNPNGISETRSLGKKALEYHKNGGRERDLAIISLFLGTGVRVSELCSLDISDFDLTNHSFRVIRKGEHDDNAYTYLDFSSEVAEYLKQYLLKRSTVLRSAGSSDLSSDNLSNKAYFLSRIGKRITVRQVENIVAKYAKLVAPNKKITPHSLRRSFGMSIYETTQDLFLTSELLGHRDVKTTRDNYTTVTRERRKEAIKKHRIR